MVDDAVSNRLTVHRGANVTRAAILNAGGATDCRARLLDDNDPPFETLRRR